MISSEPKIKVAIVQDSHEVSLSLEGGYLSDSGQPVTGSLIARSGSGAVTLEDAAGQIIAQGGGILLSPARPATSFFTLLNVRIGIDFHWDRLQTLSFRGGILLKANRDHTLSVFNIIGLEDYLASVISSEMSADAPLEFLKSQAITARSWLVAMLEKKKAPRIAQIRNTAEIKVWQDINDHEGFDVCADDHCQRYQGITRIISENVARAIDTTRGMFLTSGGRICDARYYKCCGGQTDVFATAWEDASFPYLSTVTDNAEKHAPIKTEKEADAWLIAKPEAYCNTSDQDILRRILPTFDLETLNFYRWRVCYKREELEEILKTKSGIDFGILRHLEPLARGPSGRIHRLRIEGSLCKVIVGKELEIRRWLSPTHLLSSAFVVTTERNTDGTISRFILDGGGWGHGVGLCQIGAAVMAVRGHKAEEILTHYFSGAILKKLY